MKLARIGFVICLALVVFPLTAHTENLKKKEIEETLQRLKVFPVRPLAPVGTPPPPISNELTCLVGYGICTLPDGTVEAYCIDPAGTCSGEPSPSICPDLCEEEGGIVVVDYGLNPCETLQAGKPIPFVCMDPKEYASRPRCSNGLVLHYNSNHLDPWVCEKPVGSEHVSTSVIDALLYEHARTNFIQQEMQKQIDCIINVGNCRQ